MVELKGAFLCLLVITAHYGGVSAKVRKAHQHDALSEESLHMTRSLDKYRDALALLEAEANAGSKERTGIEPMTVLAAATAAVNLVKIGVDVYRLYKIDQMDREVTAHNEWKRAIVESRCLWFRTVRDLIQIHHFQYKLYRDKTNRALEALLAKAEEESASAASEEDAEVVEDAEGVEVFLQTDEKITMSANTKTQTQTRSTSRVRMAGMEELSAVEIQIQQMSELMRDTMNALVVNWCEEQFSDDLTELIRKKMSSLNEIRTGLVKSIAYDGVAMVFNSIAVVGAADPSILTTLRDAMNHIPEYHIFEQVMTQVNHAKDVVSHALGPVPIQEIYSYGKAALAGATVVSSALKSTGLVSSDVDDKIASVTKTVDAVGSFASDPLAYGMSTAARGIPHVGPSLGIGMGMGMGMGMGSVLGGSPAKVNVPSVSVFTAAPTVTKEALSKVEGALHLDAFLEKAREHNIVFSDVHLGSIADKITHALHGEEVKAALVKAGSAATTVLSSVAKAIPLAVALKKLYDSCSSLVEEQNQMVEIRELLEKDRRQLALDTFKMCKTLLQLSIYEDKQIHLMSEFTVTVDRMLKSLSTSSAEFVNVLQDYDAPAFHAGLRAVCPHDKNLCWRLLQSYGVHHLGQVGVSAADVSIAFDALRYGAITDFAMIEWDASSSNKAGDLGTIGYVPLAVIPGAKRALWACRECSDHCIIDVRFSSKPRAACDELRRAHPSSSAALCRNMPFHDDIHLVYLQSVSGGHRVCLHDVFITHMKESADTVKQTGQFAALDYQRVSDRSAKSTSATDALHTGAMYAATGLAHVLTLGGLAIAKHGFGADTPLDFDKMGRYTFSSGLAAFSRTAPFGTSQRLDPRVEYQISVINPGCNIPEPYASLKYAAPIKEGVNAWLEPVARRSKAKCEEFYPLSSIDSFSDVIVCSTYYQKDYCDMLLDLGYRVVSYTGRKLDSVQVLTRSYSRAPGLSFSLNIGPRFDAYGRLMRGPEPPKVELSESEKILRTMGLLSEMFKLRLCSGECHFSDENPFPEWVNGRPVNIEEHTSDMASKRDRERANYSRKVAGILRFHPLEQPPATHTHAPVLVASSVKGADLRSLYYEMRPVDRSAAHGREFYILERFFCDERNDEDDDDEEEEEERMVDSCYDRMVELEGAVKDLSAYRPLTVSGDKYSFFWKLTDSSDNFPVVFFEKIWVLESYQVPTEREAVCKGSNLDPRVARYEFDQLIKGIQDDNKALLFR